jgi:hypothetical protein
MMRLAPALLLLAAACGHSEPFGSVPSGSDGPFSSAAPARLTYNSFADSAASLTEDGNGLLYLYTGGSNGDRCVGLIPPGGGTGRWQLCDTRADRADSVKSFSAPALGTDGRLLYQEALSRRGRTNPEATVLWLADSATPFTRRALLTLPANVGGRAISWFTDAVWVGQDEFIARTGQLTFDAACGACPADTLLAGVALMRGTITATGVTLAVIPGTVDITRHAFAENGTSFVVVRNSAALERLPIAGGTSTPIVTLPRAGTISGLSCRGTECLVTQYVERPFPASGLDTWFYRVSLGTNTVTSLRLETGLWTGPVLLATGGDAVLQFSSAGARDLYLFKGLLP